MALLFIERFTDNNGGEYEVNYNEETSTIFTQFSSPTGSEEKQNVTQAERGSADGSEIWHACEIDQTLVSIKASLVTPFATVAKIPNSPECAPAPGICDLMITDFVVIDESQQGANDGSITVAAVSQYPNIEYSIDGVHWNTTGIFLDLTPGNYNVQVQDSNGCRLLRTAYINQYDNILVKFPVVEYGAGNKSRWSAAFNTISLGYQRKDYLITRVDMSGSNSYDIYLNRKITVSEIDYVLNDQLYVKTKTSEFLGKAISHRVTGNVSVLNIPGIATTLNNTGFIVIHASKANYKVETTIISGTNPINKVEITATHTPNVKGYTNAQIQRYLQSLVSAVDRSKYNQVNYRDINLGASYTISYQEVWDKVNPDDPGHSQPYTYPFPLYVTYAAMQLGERFGGNMAEYVTFANQPDPDKLAKWLTDFNEPIYNLGLPFDLAFIYSESVINYQLIAEYTPLDINRVPIPGGITYSYLLNDDAGYILQANGYKLLIEENEIDLENVSILDSLGINRLTLPSNFNNRVAFLKVQLYYEVDGNKKYVTQPITVKINRPCPSEPNVYLKWINHLGAWDYFRFGHDQLISKETSNESVVKRNVLDWENDDTILDVVSKTSANKITAGCDYLTADEVKGLEWLRSSIKVQWLSKPNPYKWQTVLLQTGQSNIMKTRSGWGSIKVTFTLPETNIQTQ